MLSIAYFSLLTIFCKIGYMFCPSQVHIFLLGRIANVFSVCFGGPQGNNGPEIVQGFQRFIKLGGALLVIYVAYYRTRVQFQWGAMKNFETTNGSIYIFNLIYF